MIKIAEEVEQAVSKFSSNQLQQLRCWYGKFDTKTWDDQIE